MEEKLAEFKQKSLKIKELDYYGDLSMESET